MNGGGVQPPTPDNSNPGLDVRRCVWWLSNNTISSVNSSQVVDRVRFNVLPSQSAP